MPEENHHRRTRSLARADFPIDADLPLTGECDIEILKQVPECAAPLPGSCPVGASHDALANAAKSVLKTNGAPASLVRLNPICRIQSLKFYCSRFDLRT